MELIKQQDLVWYFNGERLEHLDKADVVSV